MPESETFRDDLELALALAADADAISMRYFRSARLEVRTKSDLTMVSEADEGVERALRARLAAERPADGLVGEEFGSGGASERRWIIDPIDGTANYVRGIPVWATLIGLESGGEAVLGVVSAPALSTRWWAVRGGGAFANGRRLAVSAVESIEGAHLSYDDYAGFEKHGLAEAFLELARRCVRTRGFGDFWSYMLVAEGAVDIAVEPRVALWDMAAVQPIVEEAGGRFTDLRGRATPDGGSGVATNGRIHDQVLRILGSNR